MCGELYFTPRTEEREGERQNGNAVGRGGISSGCDKADMHVTVRGFIQNILRSHILSMFARGS